MEHLNPDCTCTVKFKDTDTCDVCVKKDHHDFMKAKNLNLPFRNALYEKVGEALKTGRNWRIQNNPNRECGHPGVRNTQGKCVFCITEKRMTGEWGAVKSEPVNNLRNAIYQLNQNIAELTGKRDTLQNLLTLDMAGFPVGKVSSVTRPTSPRQRAIQEGKNWYMPYEPCKHCGVIAERYVANGRCRSCWN